MVGDPERDQKNCSMRDQRSGRRLVHVEIKKLGLILKGGVHLFVELAREIQNCQSPHKLDT